MCNKLLCPRHYTKCPIRSNSFNPHNNNNNNNTIIIPILQKTEGQINHLAKIIRLIDKADRSQTHAFSPSPESVMLITTLQRARGKGRQVSG